MRAVPVLAGLMLSALAGGAAAGDPEAEEAMVRFIPYAQYWCGRGDAQGCEIAGTLTIAAGALAGHAARCRAGSADACLEAQSLRRGFWMAYGRLPVQPDMTEGPNGEPPARPLWDQPPSEGPATRDCQAFTPECGFFGGISEIP